jgi:type III secretory pathway component EscS
MELSLCLSFYFRCSLGGYTVGTTVGFLVEIVQALTP